MCGVYYARGRTNRGARRDVTRAARSPVQLPTVPWKPGGAQTGFQRLVWLSVNGTVEVSGHDKGA